MKKQFLTLVGFIAQLLTFTQGAQAQTTTLEKSLLWKITGKDIKAPSYAFGTIHSICNEDYFFTEKMKKAFDESKKLILEIDLTDPAMLNDYQSQLVLPEGEELKDFFTSEKEFQEFSDSVKKNMDIDVAAYTKLKPFVLISMIAMKSATCENQSSYEMNLVDMSKKNKIEVDGLETGLSQLKIFDQMKKDDIRQMLLESVQQLDEQHIEMNKLITLYKSQDVDGLYRFISASPEFKGHEKELIQDRNLNWMNTLVYEMKHQPCFIAVGAGHLAGEKGILNLLSQAGYTIEAVK